jgi:pyrimidine operon attenuation protein/uracil phosphoribosyltransferase
MEFKARIMSQEDVERTLVRLAHQIIEKNKGTENLCFVGIKTRGVPLAKRLAANIKNITGADIPVGILDITLYRDDLSKINIDPVINQTNISFPIEGKTVVLVDDVIFTCRTARAALDALVEVGRADRIQLCALIDRGHAELPIKANFVGKNIPTSLDEVVAVRLKETDGETDVCINRL